jgi:hypothetical protein
LSSAKEFWPLTVPLLYQVSSIDGVSVFRTGGSSGAYRIGSALNSAMRADRARTAPPSAMLRLWAPERRRVVKAISLPVR